MPTWLGAFCYPKMVIIKNRPKFMKLDISSSANSADKNKEWMKKHPILTGFIVLCFIFIIGSMFGGSDKTPTTTPTPQVAKIL
jgi:hypothetical protein